MISDFDLGIEALRRGDSAQAIEPLERACRTDPEKDDFGPMPAGERMTRLNEHVHFAAIVIRPRQPAAANAQDAEVAPGAGENADVITFQPTGECDAASIVLTDGRMAYTLQVAPTSGIVQLRKGASPEVADDREDLDA